MLSSSKNTSDIIASKCCPVCTSTSDMPTLRSAWLTGAALMNCGLAPTTVRTRDVIGKDDCSGTNSSHPAERSGKARAAQPREYHATMQRKTCAVHGSAHLAQFVHSCQPQEGVRDNR